MFLGEPFATNVENSNNTFPASVLLGRKLSCLMSVHKVSKNEPVPVGVGILTIRDACH